MPVAITLYMLPEDQDDYDAAQKGPAMLTLLQNLDSRLRQRVKHSDDNTGAPYEEVRKWLHDLCADEEVCIW